MYQRKIKKVEQISTDNVNNGMNDGMETKSQQNDDNRKPTKKGNVNVNANGNYNHKYYTNPKYIFHIKVLNCDYFIDHKLFPNDVANAYCYYLQQVKQQITIILNKRRFHILYILSSSSYNQLPSLIDNNNLNDNDTRNNELLSSPSNIGLIAPNPQSYHSSPKSSQHSQHSVSPLPIDANNDDSIPRIQHTLPLELKNNESTISLNNNVESQSNSSGSSSASSSSSSSSSSSISTASVSSYNGSTNEEDYRYGRLIIAVDVSEVIEHSELDLETVISIVSDEIVQTIPDGSYRLNVRFYPIYHACKHRYDTDFFYHRGLSLRGEIKKTLNNGKNKNNHNNGNGNGNSNNNGNNNGKNKNKNKNKKTKGGKNKNFDVDLQHQALIRGVLCLALTKQPTDEVIFRRFRLLKKLKDILIKCHGPDAKYEIFGSMATKLDHIESDLDVSIHLPSDNELSFANYFKHNSLSYNDLTMEVKQHRIQQILRPIYQEIIKVPKTRDGYNFKVIFLEHATVPIVKLTDENTGMQSDISVCLRQSVIKTKLIKKYVSIDWRVKPLVLAIKNWVKSRKLNNTHRGDLNSFGFTLMIIHYFQTLSPPILPILEIDEEKYCQNNDKYEPEWVSSDKFVNFGKKNKQNIGELYTGFFHFYHKQFNPAIHAISITNNNRDDKINGFLNKKLCKLQSNHNAIVIVLDPLDNSDNIGRRVTEVTWSNMQNEFKLASQIANPQNFLQE